MELQDKLLAGEEITPEDVFIKLATLAPPIPNQFWDRVRAARMLHAWGEARHRLHSGTAGCGS